MKHNAGSRRSRNRNGPKRQGGGGRNNYDSNGPDVKVRGTAQQVLEKYLALARDEASAGDRIRSESYYQYAEHYFRIVNVDGNGNANANNPGQGRRDGPGYDHNPNFNNETDGEFDQEVGGSGPQPDVPRAGDYANDEGYDDEVQPQSQPRPVADSGGNDAVKAADEDKGAGRIDESVLPAAVPTAPRRRRSRNKSSDENSDATGEPEAAQA